MIAWPRRVDRACRAASAACRPSPSCRSSIRRGHGAFDHRPERRRQDHPAQPADRHLCADSGRIVFDGVDLTGAPPHRCAAAGIGRTFQNLQIFFNMTRARERDDGRPPARARAARSPRCCTRRAARASSARAAKRALEWLRFLGLAAYADSPADALPYGALKRLEIARALAGEPSLLLLDEPAAGLNPTEALEIDALIQRDRRRRHDRRAGRAQHAAS